MPITKYLKHIHQHLTSLYISSQHKLIFMHYSLYNVKASKIDLLCWKNSMTKVKFQEYCKNSTRFAGFPDKWKHCHSWLLSFNQIINTKLTAISTLAVKNFWASTNDTTVAFSALTLLVGWQEGHPACKKNWAVGCWCGYLSGARCRLAYGPADATATHCLLLQ